MGQTWSAPFHFKETGMGRVSRRKKRIYMVNRDFQMRYIRSAVLVAVCSTALTMFLILYPLFYLNVLRFPNFLPTPFLLAAILAAVLNFSMIAWLGIHLSHRIAGPVFAMVRFIRVMASGNYTGAMRIRESDELKYLTRHLNDLAEALRDRTREDLGNLEAIETALESGNAARMRDLCDQLKSGFAERLLVADQSSETPNAAEQT